MGEVVKEYYRLYLILNKRIDRYLELKEIWEARAEKTSGELSFTPKSTPSENMQELAICKMIDYELLANAMIDELAFLRKCVREYMRLTGSEDSRLLEIVKIES